METHNTREEVTNAFWEMMEQNQFVKSTNSITDEVKEYPPAIVDMEATVAIHGEFDKYAIDDWLHHQLQKAREEHERKIDELRQHVATLYCAAGCECCRDIKVWEAESAVIAVMLGIPAYDDGSGFDFYKVRDSYHSKLNQDKK